MFALPGIILVTTFITFPFVARELIPLVRVELTRGRAGELRLASGQQVWLKPWQIKVFAIPAATLEEGGSGICRTYPSPGFRPALQVQAPLDLATSRKHRGRVL